MKNINSIKIIIKQKGSCDIPNILDCKNCILYYGVVSNKCEFRFNKILMLNTVKHHLKLEYLKQI